MKKRVIFIILMIYVIIITMTSCVLDEKEIKQTQEFFAMDTIIDITIYGENFEEAFKECNEELNRLEKLFSVNDKNSDIYAINNADGKKVEVSNDTIEIVSKSIELSELTTGDFDITIYPLVKLYGFTTEAYYAPTQEEIDEKLKLVNYKDIKVNDNSIQLKPEMEIDLGGIAKGYASDRLKEILKENGVEQAVISLGGNVETIGEKEKDEKWQVGVQNPDGEDIIMTLGVDETTIITSGAYRRNMIIDGEFYHHIIDPKTGKPADSGLKSVTVVGEDGTKGDALSTAIYVKGEDKGLEFCKENSEIQSILITEDNKIYISKTLKNSVKIAEQYKDKYEIEYF